MRFTIYQESRPGKRSNNQDRIAHCYSRDALLMLVADGMGGHLHGEVAAQIAVQRIAERFQAEARPLLPDPQLFLARAIERAHQAILDHALDHHFPEAPRTTLVACVIQRGAAYWAHAGDSRLYLLRDGRVQTHTRDHSRIQMLLEQGVINAAQAAVHPERNRVYSCLGGPQTPEIEFSRKTPLEAGDVIALCTDGVWSAFPDDMLAVALKRDNLMQAVPMLLGQAEIRNGPTADNLSIIAVRWEDSYIDAASAPSLVSTQTMSRDTVTTRLDEFGRNPNYKSELSEDEIERAIEEIRATIQKYSK